LFDGIGRRIKLKRLKRKPLPIIGFALATVVCTFPIAAWIGYGRYFADDFDRVFAVIPAAMIGLIVRSFLRECEEVDTQPEAKALQRRLRRVGLVTFLVGFAFCSSHAWTCLHGRGFKFGPIVLTVTGPEGMCRNEARLGTRHEVSKRISIYWLD
jgi:hypothetical protein